MSCGLSKNSAFWGVPGVLFCLLVWFGAKQAGCFDRVFRDQGKIGFERHRRKKNFLDRAESIVLYGKRRLPKFLTLKSEKCYKPNSHKTI